MDRLVLLRHGESTANADERFAGWLDVPLTARGLVEARAAGRTLAGLRPDAVHTSVLTRAVDTAHVVVETAGWQLSPRRDWRLNERHYGALQGIGKAQARLRHGTPQVERWRRSVDEPPPAAGPGALRAQLADPRYAAEPPARLTNGESLADVARRMAPYWHEVLRPQVAAGRTVLVVSHGNALRVLLHLATGRPLEETAGTHVPTAVPLIPAELALQAPPQAR
jgi:2,3-bisphosphoglycerate-dependent phosphoglycerate mutase